MEKDKEYLGRAVELASESIGRGGGPFGAIVVKDDMIIAEAFNTVVLSSDPTAHAEVAAIRKAASVLGTFDLSGCVLYTSCEPCPMCLGAIYWAGISRVVYASDRKDAREAGFGDDMIYEEMKLAPAERRIIFKRIEDPGGAAVFRRWVEMENKNPY